MCLINMDYFSKAAAAAGVPTLYPPSMQYQPFYQYYSVPMVSNMSSLWYSMMHLVMCLCVDVLVWR